jgi:hypothetical protein
MRGRGEGRGEERGEGRREREEGRGKREEGRGKRRGEGRGAERGRRGERKGEGRGGKKETHLNKAVGLEFSLVAAILKLFDGLDDFHLLYPTPEKKLATQKINQVGVSDPKKARKLGS